MVSEDGEGRQREAGGGTIPDWIKRFNILASIALISVGPVYLILHGFRSIFSIYGIPIYALYPLSPVIFGAFGLIVSIMNPRKLRYFVLSGIACSGLMFDLFVTFIAQLRPDLPLFLLWMAGISTFFLLARLNVLLFLVNPWFWVWVGFIALYVLKAIPSLWWTEATQEIPFCAIFWSFVLTDRTPRNPG